LRPTTLAQGHRCAPLVGASAIFSSLLLFFSCQWIVFMTPADSWIVHKFGGSSLADASCFERVAAIVESQSASRMAVVLSACRGVTDALLHLIGLAERRDRGYGPALAQLRDRHRDTAEKLLPRESAALYLAALARDCKDIEGILHTVELTRSAARNVSDLIAGYGEIWSTRLFHQYLESRGRARAGLEWIDARRLLIVQWGPLGPAVQWEDSRARLREIVPQDFQGILVVTGFIASDRQGVQTTLGRNGSDYSASIFGALLEAAEIVIWTDVDGVLSADPARVPDAKVIDSISYNEAMELAYFGAKVIHPQTMAPAIGRDIPIWIRNTFAPERSGTLICARPTSQLPVKGITSIERIALINLEGAGMIGVPGTAHRLFGALREEGISVILISQGSSEHSICCAIPQSEADRAVAVVRSAFARELDEAQIQSVELDPDLAILAVVGDGMAGTPGVSAKLFNALGGAAVNVRAIAQGASERNISVVVDGRSATRALRAVHAGFYLSPHTISIGVIGPGTVGRVLLDQLASQRQRLADEFKLDLRVRGIMGSKRMLLTDDGAGLAAWREQLESRGRSADLTSFFDHVRVDYLPHTVLIDCTASEAVARSYRDWLAAGVHIVTPNKKANSADLAYFRSLQEARRASGARYLYEATVGAGLPIIQTLRDLRETGDEITGIEGIFSGTLAYLFNVYDGRARFSEIVRDARERGYTEPDPRDDLSGMDVARKLIILGREMGLGLEMSDVRVESLVPAGLEQGSVEEFMQRLPSHDAAMAARFDAARARGKVLRYVARLAASGEATVGLAEVAARHAFANISLTDNIVRFATLRYCDNPLIVQGPGAGPQVTAGGVFADLLRLAAYLGARL
jgi:bifunctional aspartokinase / homoserine dehydrogenase 1